MAADSHTDDKANYRDEEWLRKQYVDDCKTAPEIADMCDCSKKTVYRWLQRYEIPRRVGGSLGERKQVYERLSDAKWLRNKYISEQMSSREIAKEVGCSRSTVLNWVSEHNIETDQHKKTPNKFLQDKNWLRKKYIGENKSGYEIAQQLGCSTTAVYKWIDEHSIPLQYNGKVSGEDHWWYSGGRILYGAGWNETKKQTIRERDNYVCQDPRCSVTQTEHNEKYGRKLHVHHLQKARDVDDPEERNDEENLITLCRDCHQRWEKIADAGLVPQVDI